MATNKIAVKIEASDYQKTLSLENEKDRNKAVKAIMSSPATVELRRKWTDVAIGLDVNSEDRDDIKRKIKNDVIETTTDILHTVLERWIATAKEKKEGEDRDVTLEKLVKAISDATLNDMASRLMLAFPNRSSLT